MRGVDGDDGGGGGGGGGSAASSSIDRVVEGLGGAD